MAPVFVDPVRAPMPPPVPVPVPMARHPAAHYATYHGPPPEIRHPAQRTSSGTMSGPPPIVIPFGTVTVRPDPRPVVHKAARKRDSNNSDVQRRTHKHRSKEGHKSQEFVIQQSYDGIPVIRPVIYVDDDDTDRKNHRSKSRERRYKKRSREASPSSPRIT